MAKLTKRILAVDIGGSHIKCTILDEKGKILQEYTKVVTPQPATPAKVLAAIKVLVKDFPPYNSIAVGFPGYVKTGIVVTAPNLASESWKNIDLAKMLTGALHQPAKVVNDADLQGLGIAKGKGLEMVITLGTGFGTALLNDGTLLPHLELAHHPVAKKLTYDDYIGEKALEKLGEKKWNERLKRILVILKVVFNYDTLYISGGNARKINFKLDKNIHVVNNIDGIHGGAKLWATEK
jgi:polyphosphate glucokinase